MSKPKSPRDKAWDAFSLYIRLRDCLKTMGIPDRGVCITCGNIYPFNKLQAGHFIAGRSNAVLFCERGVNAQCVHCNYFCGGKPLKYRQRMVERYGEVAVQDMEIQAEIPKKIRSWEYDAIRIHYQNEYKKLGGCK